jgi:putative flippase GtrA
VGLLRSVEVEDAPVDVRVRAGRLAWIMSVRMRPARFLLVGGATAVVQLGLLAVLLGMRWPSLVGNAAALAIAMQVNFALSAGFTWVDRWGEPLLGEKGAPSAWWVALSRWVRFMGAAAGSVLLNEAGYDLAQQYWPALVAAAVCSAVVAALNYFVVGRLVFRRVAPH